MDTVKVPVGEYGDLYKAKVIYHKKGSIWAVTKLEDSYWRHVKDKDRYSTITYIGPNTLQYGLSVGMCYKPLFLKGIQYSKRFMNQKELIILCKWLNDNQHTPETLKAMDKYDRREIFGRLNAS